MLRQMREARLQIEVAADFLIREGAAIMMRFLPFGAEKTSGVEAKEGDEEMRYQSS